MASEVVVVLNDNGICDTNDVYGCTASIAYAKLTQRRRSTMAKRKRDLGSRRTDSGACNYDESTDYNWLLHPQLPYGCDGECINDTDEDGICDEFEIPGCTDGGSVQLRCRWRQTMQAIRHPSQVTSRVMEVVLWMKISMASDDVDPCVGRLGCCGVCNGLGEIYECGCADIPEGDCDCDGSF